jgi:hypothetical protein
VRATWRALRLRLANDVRPRVPFDLLHRDDTRRRRPTCGTRGALAIAMKIGLASLSLFVLASGCAIAPAEESNTASTDSAFKADTFSFDKFGSGLFEMKGLAGKCIDFGAPPQVVGGPVFLYGCNGSIAQQIRAVETSDFSNVYELRAGDKCIQPRAGVIANGTPLVLAACDGSDAQHFERDGDTRFRLSKWTNFLIQVQGAQTANCQFAGSWGHCIDDFCRVMGPPDLQHHGATRAGDVT